MLNIARFQYYRNVSIPIENVHCCMQCILECWQSVSITPCFPSRMKCIILIILYFNYVCLEDMGCDNFSLFLWVINNNFYILMIQNKSVLWQPCQCLIILSSLVILIHNKYNTIGFFDQHAVFFGSQLWFYRYAVCCEYESSKRLCFWMESQIPGAAK